MNTIQIKINKPIPPYQKDQVVTVYVNEFQTPVRKFWRDRLRDAVIDECVEIVAPKKKPNTPKEKS